MRSFFSTSFLILVDLQKNLPIKERADKVDFQYCNISDINVDNTTWKLWRLHYLVLAENRWPKNSDLRIFVSIDILYLTTLGSHQKIIWKGFIFIENLECQSAWKLKLGKGSFFKTLYVGEQYYSDLKNVKFFNNITFWPLINKMLNINCSYNLWYPTKCYISLLEKNCVGGISGYSCTAVPITKNSTHPRKDCKLP